MVERGQVSHATTQQPTATPLNSKGQRWGQAVNRREPVLWEASLLLNLRHQGLSTNLGGPIKRGGAYHQSEVGPLTPFRGNYLVAVPGRRG